MAAVPRCAPSRLIQYLLSVDGFFGNIIAKMSESASTRPVTEGPAPQLSPWWLSVIVFGGLLGLGLWLAPPLYNFDGYMYRLQGRNPLENLNPTHLIWVPIQAVIWQVCDWFHWASPVPFQVVGIGFSALAHALFFRLLARRPALIPLALATTVFVATSPWVWQLTPINQPYPLLFLLVVLLLFVWRKVPDRPATLVGLGGLILLAALLQEAAGLWWGAGVGLLVGLTPGPLGQRWRRAIVWGVSVAAAVGGAFWIAAVRVEIDSVRGFIEWTTGYTQSQHGLLQRPVANLVKGGMGIVQSLLQCDRWIDWLQRRYTAAQILTGTAVVEVAVLALGGGTLCFPRPRQWVRHWPWQAPLFLASLALAGVWAVFCVVWEPTGYYWSVALFPVFTGVVLILENAPATSRRWAISLLLAGTAWNLHQGHRADQHNGARFPDPQLARIRQIVRPQDELLFLQPAWIDQVDYDLLQNCLELGGRTNTITLVEKYLVASPLNWEVPLAHEINAVLNTGGRVYISNLVFRPEFYEDLAGEGAFSTYSIEANHAIQGPELFERVQQFFQRYPREPAELQIGADHFWVIAGRTK